MPVCLAKLSSDFTVSSSTLTAISWGSVEGSSAYWNISNPTRLVVPSGITEIELFVSLQGLTSVSGDFQVEIRKNGTTYIRGKLHDGAGYRPMNYASGILNVTPGDYFELLIARYGSSDFIFSNLYSTFAIATTNKAGFFSAKLLSNTLLSTGSDTILQWDTPEVDTLSARNSATKLVVPAASPFMLVSLPAISTTFNTGPHSTFKVLKNGSPVAWYENSSDWWVYGCPMLGPIPVAMGDEITIAARANGQTLNAAYTRFSVEWIN
jgi:hypothetical protein